MRDRKPPSLRWGLRCPPGRVFTGRAILMALAPSIHPLGCTVSFVLLVLRLLNCDFASVAVVAHLFRQPAPSPVVHLRRPGIPLPGLPGARARSLGAFTVVMPVLCCWYCTH